MRRSARAAAVAAMVVVLGALAGCSGDEDPPEAEQSQSEPSAPLATVDEEGLPPDFPEDEVPLVEGAVKSVEVGDEDSISYTVALTTDEEQQAALDEAAALLEEAGWQLESEGAEPQSRILTRDGGDLVVISGVEFGSETLLTYGIDLSS